MKRLVVSALIFATALAHGPIAAAQEFEMESVEALQSPDIDLQVIGGERQNPAAWPATLVFRTGGSGCTATVVGERVVLTAAHCVGNGASGRVTLRGRTVRVTCNHHPEYGGDQRPAPDFALCVTREGETFPELPFEVVNDDISRPAVDGQVMLLGYGCLTEGGEDRSFGDLYGGTSTVTAVRRQGYYTRTEGGAAVCFGDSGGGSFIPIDANTRVLFGVNSRGNISTRSLISTTSAPGFIGWAQDWAAEVDAEICGIDEGADGCRPM